MNPNVFVPYVDTHIRFEVFATITFALSASLFLFFIVQGAVWFFAKVFKK